MASVIFTSNAKAVKKEIESLKETALEIIGGTAETYAAQLCPVGTPESTGIPGYKGGTLRDSITHWQVDSDTEAIGSNVSYASYVELGTIKMRARPYLRPAAENHGAEYSAIIKKIMKV